MDTVMTTDDEFSVESLEALQAEKQKKCKALKGNVAKILTERLHTPLLIIYAVCLTLIALITLIRTGMSLASKDGIVSAILFLPMVITVIVSAVCAWKLYGLKTTVTADKMKGLTAFLAYMQVISVFACMIVMLVGILLAVGGSFLFDLFAKMGGVFGELGETLRSAGGTEAGDISSGLGGMIQTAGSVVLILIIMIAAALIFTFFNITLMFSKSRRHIRFLKEAVSAGNYDVTVRVPVKRCYVFGVICAIGAIPMVALDWMTALMSLGIGGYLFVTALLFRDIHKAEQANQTELDAETAALKELEDQVTQMKRQRAEAEKRAERARREEEHSAQQQQQMMMQQMMMQMLMKNAGNIPEENNERTQTNPSANPQEPSES